MGKRDDRQRRQARRARQLAEAIAVASRRAAAPPKRSSMERMLVLGKDPRTTVALELSGVRLPFDQRDAEPNDGLAELTELARTGGDEN